MRTYIVKLADKETGQEHESTFRAVDTVDATRIASNAGWLVVGTPALQEEDGPLEYADIEQAVFWGVLKAMILVIIGLNVLWAFIWFVATNM